MIANVSQWQSVMQSSMDSPERYLARRNLTKFTGEILAIIEAPEMARREANAELVASARKMLAALESLRDTPVARQEKSVDLYVSFRSIAEITEYKAYKLQEKMLMETNAINSRRFITLVLFLLLEVAILAVLASLLVRDIQKRKLAEKSVISIKTYLDNVINSISSQLVSIDTVGTIVNCNISALAALGLSAEDVIGRNVAGAYPFLKPLMEELLRTLSAKTVFERLALPVPGPDRREVFVDIKSYPLITENGVEGAVLWLDDVSNKIKLEEQLRQTQKMNVVGQLAGGVAHDFNNSLMGIIGAAELLKLGTASLSEREEYLQMILTAANRAGDLTKKLLLFSHKAHRASTVVDLAGIVEDTVALLRRTIDKGIEVMVVNEADRTMVVGDDSLLQNCFMNLGINASHAILKEGSLTFTLVNRVLDREFCSGSSFKIAPGEYLEVSVRDTGHGMSPEIVSRIFEPFFTTKEQGRGTGLGLAGVYGTVVDHHGALDVDSEVGVGTVFRLYFPLAAGQASVVSREDAATHGTGTILLADDEELIRVTTKALLEGLGYKVIIAENGVQCVARFQENRPNVDLVLLDMVMPIMGGRDAFKRIRAIDPLIPVIIASGFSKEEDLESAREQGVSGFLNKPFRRVELSLTVAKCMRNRA